MTVARLVARLRFLAVLLLASPAIAQPDPDAAFQALVGDFLDDLFAARPVLATRIGDHRFDAELDDVSPESILAWVGSLRQYRARLRLLDVDDLSPENQVDARILEDALESMMFDLTELREYTWNPLLYNDLLGGGLYALTSREFAPWSERARSALGRLRQIPRLAGQAMANLENAPPLHVETARQQNTGTIALIRDQLMPRFAETPEIAAGLQLAAEEAVAALEAYGAWLRDDLAPRATREFRLGPALFDRKLQFALSTDLSREEILRRAESEFERVRRQMYEVARQVYAEMHPFTSFPPSPDEAYRTVVIRAALERAAAVHPPRDGLLAAAASYLEETASFVREHDLVTIADEPIRIVEVPAFMRGVAAAYCDAPGPLDRNLNTYYMVSPIPESWPSEQVDSFLREYNAYSLRELTIHEAMPGHFVQLAIANRFPSVLRAVFASGTFVEGWATYAEKVMDDAGFLRRDPRMRLTRLKWYLRTIVNAILDQKVHTAGMTEEQAMRLMVEGAFQEEAEAAGKWRRVVLTSTQLSTYFVGYQEHLDMRAEVEARWGDEFHVQDYHDLLLAHGSPPIRYLRSLLLP